MSETAPHPVFIDGPNGRLLAVYYGPRPLAGGAVLFVPPFAEEMNRSRRMAALMGRRFAAQGIGFLVLDLYGTGDSAGDFLNARWSLWRDDVVAGLEWLSDQGANICSLLGLRLGACLAADIARDPARRLGRLIVWQPVLRGEIFLNQFLRIRVASEIDAATSGAEVTTKSLKESLNGGNVLEIAGYQLHPELASALSTLRFVDLAEYCNLPIHWLEVAQEPCAPLAPASATAVLRLRESGRQVSSQTVPGESFWVIEEPANVPALVQATADIWRGNP